ncbi:cache domain-containing protein [Aestuariivivens sediminicola]|uniref:cache domain-containing protein n=1 Tax=Aestuariivivens sediminicola TaxID=2913560 RepID=UPI001F59FBD5|nr:cache domain-containing protein [Aestuariivivens sediminicola]
MKRIPYFRQLFLSFILIALASCDCSDDDQHTLVSQTELNKAIVKTNVINVATGLHAIYQSSFNTGSALEDISRHFIKGARFFDDNSGYLFIETLDEAYVIAHIKEDWIGTSRIHAQDANGKYHVQELLEIINTSGFGFSQYYLENPATGLIEAKTSFVSGIRDVPWFIGSGYYGHHSAPYYTEKESKSLLIKDLTRTMAGGIGSVINAYLSSETDATAFCRSFIDRIRFFDDRSGYFFIYNTEGLCIAHGTQKEQEGENQWDLKDVKDNYVLRDIIDVVNSNTDGGYYSYYWWNPSKDKIEPKTAFAMKIPGTDYFIGTGIYHED